MKTRDIVGGKMVIASEYIDLTTMMTNTSLYEMDSSRDYFT